MNFKLPQLSWFRQIQDNRPVKNFLTGSLGTDPEHGCLRKRTFNYKVNAIEIPQEGQEDKIMLSASCYIRLPWAQNLECVNHQFMEFEFSAEGISQAEQWLEEQYKKLMLHTADSAENN